MSHPLPPDADHKNAESAAKKEPAKKEPTKTPHGKSRWRRSGSGSGTGTGVPGTGAGGGKSRWTTLAALALALIAVAIAIVAWYHPAHSSKSHFNDQQTADAKKNTCAAYTSVRQAVITNTHLENPGGNDPIGQFAVAANARLALLGGGQYLKERLAAEPATPHDLANAVTSMANTIENLGMGYLAGASAFAQDPLRQDLDSQIGQIDQLCA